MNIAPRRRREIAQEFFRRPEWRGYLLAVLAWGAAFALRFGLADWFPPGFPYLTFFPAVVLVAYFAGLRPAIMTATLSGLAAWWFWIGPQGFDFGVATLVALSFYIFVVAVDIFFIVGLDGASRRLSREVERNAALAASREILLREMEHRASERLRAEEKLRELQKMEALGQLTGGVAHDFNNLLTVVLGNAENLLEADQPAAVRSLAADIFAAAERGAHLTQHLLAFGRRQSLKLESLSMQNVVEGMLPLVRRSLGEQIELKTSFEESYLGALADRVLLESAILNLALNAKGAMPVGGTVTIATGQRAARGDELPLFAGQDVVWLTVSDTGTGMTDEVLRHAFEPFFTTKEVGSGSGLGLSMIQGFAGQSGGRVAIESRLGEGTSVSIVLPAVISASPAVTSASSADATTAPSVVGGSARVLLVEDEPLVLQHVSTQLLSLGYEVTAFANATDAASALNRGEEFDLLFTDVVLPKGMSGLDLARVARRLRPELKVLLTSGYSDELFGGQGGVGAEFDLLRKPYRRQALAEAVRVALASPPA